jgi:hypothetical protein
MQQCIGETAKVQARGPEDRGLWGGGLWAAKKLELGEKRPKIYEGEDVKWAGGASGLLLCLVAYFSGWAQGAGRVVGDWLQVAGGRVNI